MTDGVVGQVPSQECRGCGTVLTESNDSDAHVIPNALGGRLKPRGIICRNCNTKLDVLADKALVMAFGDWPTLLDIPRDRGPNPPKLIETRNGRRVRLEPDGSLTATDVKYDVEAVEDGHSVQIAAGDMKTIRQLLKRVKKQFPEFDPQLAEKHAQVVGVDDDDQLKLKLDFSPKAVFGGIITAIWIFLIHTTGRTFMEWNHLLKVIQAMQAHGGTFRYFIMPLPGLRGPEIPLGHKIVVRSVPSSGKLIAYVEILGILKVGGIFADAGGPGILVEHIYAYDMLGRVDRSAEFQIDADDFDRQDWTTVGLGPADAAELRAHFQAELEAAFIRRYRERFVT